MLLSETQKYDFNSLTLPLLTYFCLLILVVSLAFSMVGHRKPYNFLVLDEEWN